MLQLLPAPQHLLQHQGLMLGQQQPQLGSRLGLWTAGSSRQRLPNSRRMRGCSRRNGGCLSSKLMRRRQQQQLSWRLQQQWTCRQMTVLSR